MAGSKPAALPLGYTPSLYCAGHAAGSLKARAACQSSIVSRRRESPCSRSMRRGTSSWRAGVGFRRRELVGRERDAPEPLLERRERAVRARLPSLRGTRDREGRAANAASSRRAATSRAAPTAGSRDPSACACRRATSPSARSACRSTCERAAQRPAHARSSASASWCQRKLA